MSALEKQLEEERQKSEDLQFRIDEATICGGNETVINSISISAASHKIGEKLF